MPVIRSSIEAIRKFIDSYNPGPNGDPEEIALLQQGISRLALEECITPPSGLPVHTNQVPTNEPRVKKVFDHEDLL